MKLFSSLFHFLTVRTSGVVRGSGILNTLGTKQNILKQCFPVEHKIFQTARLFCVLFVQGDTGPPGQVGEEGVMGMQGLPGDAGPQGRNGRRGDDVNTKDNHLLPLSLSFLLCISV